MKKKQKKKKTPGVIIILQVYQKSYAMFPRYGVWQM